MNRSFLVAISSLAIVVARTPVAGQAVSIRDEAFARPSAPRGGALVSFDALRLGVAPSFREARTAPDGYDCDASLQKRLAIGAITGAILGTATYFAFATIIPKGSGGRGRYALALIVPATVIGALREAQYPSRLSCPHG
jgi:hypothetical protein